MSLCNSCQRLKVVDICTEILNIGEAPLANKQYNIIFTSTANGFRVRYRATSDADGMLVLNFPDELILAENTGYELTINRTNNPDDADDLIIGGVTADCYLVSFTHVLDGGFEESDYPYYIVAENEQTLTIA